MECPLQRWVISFVAFVFFVFPAHAAYPEKPIRIIAAFAPGSSTDIVARLLGEQLSGLLGYKDFEANTWFALFAPGKTPSAVLDLRNAQVTTL